MPLLLPSTAEARSLGYNNIDIPGCDVVPSEASAIKEYVPACVGCQENAPVLVFNISALRLIRIS